MISLKNVTKYFNIKNDRKYILRDVSLTIPGGLNIGILGRNGVGKSTFLRMLGGIDFPNSGKIRTDYNFSWPLGLTGSFQGSLSGRDNTKFICRVYSRTDAERRQTVAFVADFSELGGYFDMPVKTYSTGMRARLGFAISLAFNFDYYLIDETLTVGDIKFRKKCTEAFQNLQQNSHILLVAHNMIVLKQLCDCGIVLNDGELTYFDKIDDAVEYYQAS